MRRRTNYVAEERSERKVSCMMTDESSFVRQGQLKKGNRFFTPHTRKGVSSTAESLLFSTAGN
jgi:hypothetical protein